MPTNHPASTCNTDLSSLYRRINRFIVEVTKSQSSGLSLTSSFDTSRALSYLDSLRGYITWMIQQPLLDLPETGPMELVLEKSPDLPFFENESLYDICVLFEILRDELVNSQSARMSSGLTQHDHTRAVSIIQKIENLITQYIATQEPLDLPESSPMREITGAGRTGI